MVHVYCIGIVYLTGLSVFFPNGFLSMLITCADFRLPREDWLCASSAGERDSRVLEILEISQTG